MKVLLIRPNLAEMRSSDAMPPLSLGILAALTPPGIDVSLVDERLEEIDYTQSADLVAITVESFTAKNAYRIASEFRRRGSKVVMGGWHPTFMPDESLQHCDAVVVGEAEGLWQQVIVDFKAGRLQQIYRHERPPELNSITPERSIYAGKKYLPLDLVEYGRGCPFSCEFCSIHAFYGTRPRHRSLQETIADLNRLGRRHVAFVDDNLLANTERACELLEALIPLKIKWSCQTSIHVCEHPELLRLMQQSGCELVMVGLESLDPRNLQQMNKTWSTGGEAYAQAIGKLQDHGIMVWGSFVLGYDHDTPDSFDLTADFAIRTKMFLANFNPLVPMPGTDLYVRLKAEGRLLYDRWWIEPGYRWGHAVYRPRNMTPEQLTDGCFRARRRFNSYSSMFRRMLDRRTHGRSFRNLGAFLLGNYVMRKEIYQKHGLLLGSRGGVAVEEPLDEPLQV